MKSPLRRPRRIYLPSLQQLERLELLTTIGGTILPISPSSLEAAGAGLIQNGHQQVRSSADLAGLTHSRILSQFGALLAREPASPGAGTTAPGSAVASFPTVGSLKASAGASTSSIRPMTMSTVSTPVGRAPSFGTGVPDAQAILLEGGALLGSGGLPGFHASPSSRAVAQGSVAALAASPALDSSPTSPGTTSGSTTDPGSTTDGGAFNGSVTVTDDGGDSITETVTSAPTPDGGFTLSVTLSDSYGDQPTAASASADSGGGDVTTNGGSDTFTTTFTVGPSSIVATEVEDEADTYSSSQTLSGATGSGTWKASGKDKFHENETVTLNADGSGSVSAATNSTSTDKYALALTATTADGHTTTQNDSGQDKLTTNDSGSVDTQGNNSESLNEHVNSQETNTVDESGGGLDVGGTSKETVDFLTTGSDLNGVYNATTADTYAGTGSSHYSNSDALGDGATYNVTDAGTDKASGSDTTTYGSTVPTTEEVITDDAKSDKFSLNIANVPDGSGSGSGSSSGSGYGSGSGSGYGSGSSSASGQGYGYSPSSGSGSGSSQGGVTDGVTESTTLDVTWHRDEVISPDANGTPVATKDDVADSTTTSDSESGQDPGPFSKSDSGSYSSETTGAGTTVTQTPPNATSSGDLNTSAQLIHELETITDPAYQPASGIDPTTMTVAQANPPAPKPPKTALPVGNPVQDRADLDAALAELHQNADFERLFTACGGKIHYVPLLLSPKNGNLTFLLGSTPRMTNPITVSHPQDLRIYLNSLEFRVLRATDPANYQRLLKETIVHETIHAFIKIGDKTKLEEVLGDNPSGDNKIDSGFGGIGLYMFNRYKPNDATKAMFGDFRLKYAGHFLDIDRNSQAFIKKIVP